MTSRSHFGGHLHSRPGPKTEDWSMCADCVDEANVPSRSPIFDAGVVLLILLNQPSLWTPQILPKSNIFSVGLIPIVASWFVRRPCNDKAVLLRHIYCYCYDYYYIADLIEHLRSDELVQRWYTQNGTTFYLQMLLRSFGLNFLIYVSLIGLHWDSTSPRFLTNRDILPDKTGNSRNTISGLETEASNSPQANDDILHIPPIFP